MFLKADRPKFPLDFVGRIARPKPHNDVDRFSHHGAALLGVDSVDLQSCWYSASTKTDVQSTMGQMIQKRKSASYVHRMVILQADWGRSQTNCLCHAEGLGDKNFRHD